MSKPAKAEIREWLKRVREDVRIIERSLKEDAAEHAMDAAEDLSGAGGEVFNLVTSRYDDGSWHEGPTG